MKIIQSYWSNPARNEPATDQQNVRFLGGWPNEKYHAISWAFSCLQLTKFHGAVELFTDTDGEKWLVNKCGIPFKEVYSSMNSLYEYNSSLWALSKIFTYSIQSEPFLHIDGDVYVWQPFTNEIMNSSLLVQNFEEEGAMSEMIQEIRDTFTYIPECVRDINLQMPVPSVNAGIIGGTTASFFSAYAREVLDFIKKNEGLYEHLDSENFNVFFEQIIFCHFAKQNNILVKALKSNVGKLYSSILKLNTAPQLCTYIHMIGYAKKNLLACRQMEAHFRYLYPKMHRHISQLYKGKDIYNISNTKSSQLKLSSFVLNNFDQGAKYSASDIEKILEDSFEDPKSYLLWDVYQLEKALLEINLFRPGCDLSFLYELTVHDFLTLSFKLNAKRTSILYLYHKWPSETTLTEIENLILKGNTLPKNPKPGLWAFSTKNNIHQLKPLEGWNLIYIYLNERLHTGFEIIDKIKENKKFIYTGENMENDLYDFLTFQIFGLESIVISDKPTKKMNKLLSQPE